MHETYTPRALRAYVKPVLVSILGVPEARVRPHPLAGPFTDEAAIALYWVGWREWERDANLARPELEVRLFPKYVGEPDREEAASDAVELETVFEALHDALKPIAYADPHFYFTLTEAAPNWEQWSVEGRLVFYTRNTFTTDP